jgi:hypothetical protein
MVNVGQSQPAKNRNLSRLISHLSRDQKNRLWGKFNEANVFALSKCIIREHEYE